MSFSVIMQNCIFCHELKKSLILANMNLPLNKKIFTFDVHSGDSRISFMEQRFPGGRYPLPATILDSNVNIKGNKGINRTILMSSSIKDLDKELIKLLA